MILSIFLALGDSFTDMKKSGQDAQFLKFYLSAYAAQFSKIYLFSYAKEAIQGLPRNVELVEKSANMHRYMYALALPFMHRRKIKNSNAVRAYHITGTIPAIISKLVYGKPFIFNYAFNYKKFALIDKKYFQLLLLYLSEPLAFFFARKIFIANRKYLKKTKKSVYLPNGVDTNYFKPLKKRRRNQIIKFISVGRLTSQKNFHTLVKSLHGLKNELTIIGRGPLEKALVEEAKKFRVNLKIIEHVSHNQMPGVFNSADVFILPSKIEGHPKSLLEAMSCALPVIITNVEGSQEIVKEGINGLVTGLTPESIRTAVDKLLSDKKLMDKLSTKAREDILKNFSLKKLIQKEIETVKSLQ